MSKRVLVAASREVVVIYDREAVALNREIMRIAKSDMTARAKDAAIKKAIKDSGINDTLAQSILDGVYKAAVDGVQNSTLPAMAFKKWYYDKAYSTSGVKFSTQIANIVDGRAITDVVRQSLKVSDTWIETARNITDAVDIKAKLPAAVEDLIAQARKGAALSGDVEGYARYRATVNQVKRRVMAMKDPSKSKLGAAYNQIIKATEKGSERALTRAINSAVLQKTRNNAERISRTEITRAYGDAFTSDVLQDEHVEGYKSVLSSAHPKYDICNVHAAADLYGYGAGVYPKGKGPEYPYHPNCMCSLVPVYRLKGDGADAMKDKAGQDYLSSISEEHRVELLGVSGAAEFARKPSTWQKNMRHWHGHETKKITIPKSILMVEK